MRELSASRFSIFFACTVLIYFVFSPVITIPSYHHDTYKYTDGGIAESCEKEIGYHFSFALARPFTAYLDCANFKLGNTPEKLSDMRIGIDILIGLTMGLLVFWLVSVNFSLQSAFVIAGAIFCLPAMNAAMIMGGSFLIMPVLMALGAYLLIEKSRSLIPAAIICLVCSFLTYPAMTGFFLVPALVLTLFNPLSEWHSTRQSVLRDVVIFSVSCVIYFIVAKLIKVILHVNPDQIPAPYRMNLNLNPFPRWVSMTQIFPLLWDLDFQVGFFKPFLFYVLTAAGSVIALVKFSQHAQRHRVIQLLQACLAVLMLLTLGSILFMVQPQNTWAERILFVFQAMSVIIVVWSLLQISSLYRSKSPIAWLTMLFALFVFAVITTNYRATNIVLGDNKELSFVTGQMAAHFQKNKITHIHVISSLHAAERANSTYFPADIENIVKTSFHKMAVTNQVAINNCIYLPSGEEAKQKDVMKCVKAADRHKLTVTFSRFGQPFYHDPATLVIDMNAMDQFGAPVKMDSRIS